MKDTPSLLLPLEDRTLQFGPVRTASQLLEVQSLRYQQYQARTPDVVPELLRDFEFDRRGFVFLLRDRSRPVATGRIIRVDSGVIALHHLAALPQPILRDPKVCEISRLAALAAGGTLLAFGTAMFGLGLGASWALQHTPFERYVAYCQVAFLKLYTKVKAHPCSEEFTLPNREERRFLLVEGRLEDAAEACSTMLSRYHIEPLTEDPYIQPPQRTPKQEMPCEIGF
ncbi:MAG TPA: hypothetical protein VLJ17_15930 [Xanthobacteraceae bacterium]|nr:hypothetical protein [Xanthobacteraceae bacterium]